uniref:Mitochondrial carrier protein n=1 Tax=Timema tahoe TaxID=61484 RepID=A0A7R9FLT2_9NEOP|nr:unnamed protein product [Timema tahoe]
MIFGSLDYFGGLSRYRCGLVLIPVRHAQDTSAVPLRVSTIRRIQKSLQRTWPGHAGLFFCTYDTVKSRVSPHASPGFQPLVHMGAACCGEVVSCLAKVPTEVKATMVHRFRVVKQRSQAAAHPTTPLIILQTTLDSEGLRGMYRGFASTVLREIPFALLQFPLWEFLKSSWGRWQGTDLSVWQGALCGAVAGGISAAVTTPLDVAKTRIMLAERKQGATREDLRILTTLRNVYAQKGVQGLFAGFTPRVTWITVGGAVFFGVYEAMKKYCCEFSWGNYREPPTM